MKKEKILSNIRYTSSNISEKIKDLETEIKDEYKNAFDDVYTVEVMSDLFSNLSILKEVRAIMHTESYKECEKSGKYVSYDDFMTEYQKIL